VADLAAGSGQDDIIQRFNELLGSLREAGLLSN
jgi:hypothetical protein